MLTYLLHNLQKHLLFERFFRLYSEKIVRIKLGDNVHWIGCFDKYIVVMLLETEFC